MATKVTITLTLTPGRAIALCGAFDELADHHTRLANRWGFPGDAVDKELLALAQMFRNICKDIAKQMHDGGERIV